MTDPTAEFRARYAAALRLALHDSGEGSLSSAYELGRAAVSSELSVLDLAAIHSETLGAELRSSAGGELAERATLAAGAFFVESLSAYEMLQRVLRESREAARAERHHAALLRRLSSFLADASLAVDANASVQEVLQLVAEHALEVVDADACSARIDPSDGAEALEAVAYADADADPHHLPDARFAQLAAPLMALDGRPLGLLQMFDLSGERDFSELDEAVVTQLAQMAAATFERMELYRRSGPPA